MYSHRRLFFKHCAQTGPNPMGLEIVRAKGLYLTDINRKRYMDLISGISVSALGHLHPEVVRAVRRQTRRYMHLMVYGEYIQHPQVKAAKELADSLPENLSSVYFTNSGSEAVEAAMKLAKRATGRYEIAAMENAYHGSTQGALSLMGNAYFREAFRPLLPGITTLRFNEHADIQKITCRHAAVFCETIQGEAGAKVPDNTWLRALRRRCNETGTLLVLDEIQAGLGRTGTFWAFEHFDVKPDILITAKGLGGGMPIGAMVASPPLMKCLSEKPVLGHITTFGGHPVSAAAAYATLKFIRRNRLWENALHMEQVIREKLRHEKIIRISGRGLLLALDLGTAELNFKVISRCLQSGIITDWFLFNEHSLRLAPPLIIDENTLRRACGKIIEALNEQ